MHLVAAEAMFWLAAKWRISYETGTPSNESEFGVAARFAKSPNKYSVFSSRPENVRVMSTRPRQSSARSEELMALAWTRSASFNS